MSATPIDTRPATARRLRHGVKAAAGPTPVRRLPTEARINALLQREDLRFAHTHPESIRLAALDAGHHLYGVPMQAMRDWPTPAPVVVQQALGAHLSCVDGIEYVDFCLGDSAAMFGHSPALVAQAIADEARSGLSTMLPSQDVAAVGQLLAANFGMPMWQFALSASDANGFMLRWARAVTGRRHIVVFDGCDHGTVEDSYVDLVNGVPVQRASVLGQVWDPALTTRIVPYNDLAALDQALADGQVAAVLAEPALTHCGMVLPDPDFWQQARDIIGRHGSLLIFDETHTISAGHGGWARQHGVMPDGLVLGKPIAAGLPCAVYGFSERLGQRMQAAKVLAPPGQSGIGATQAGNRLTLAAVRAALEHLMTDEVAGQTRIRAELVAKGLRAAIARHGYAWTVTQLGCRVEFQFASEPSRNAQQARAAMHVPLERLIHLYLLNRGVVITPFHNMLLVCPATSPVDVSRLITSFDHCLAELTAAH